MQLGTRPRALACALALLFIAAGGGAAATAQESEAARPQGGAPARAEVNHEVQLHLLVTAEGAEGSPRVPQALDGVVRQLRSALPTSDYRLAATFLNRVRDGGAFEVKTAGGSPFNPGAPQDALMPTFFQFALSGVKMLDPGSERPSVNIQHFRLGMKVPIQTATVSGDRPGGHPVIQYEDTGLSSTLSVREGEPTIVGTLNASRPGQLFVVVVTVRRVR